jgi:Domain of unknown function (DUF397)
MSDQAAPTDLTQASGWQKSSYSQGANDCVEITTEVLGWIGVRDSKLGTSSPLLPFSAVQWTAFLEDIRTE